MKIGVILPIFNDFGNLHSLNDLFVIIFRGSEIRFISPLTNLLEVKSNPKEVLGVSPLIISLISFSFTSLKEKFSSGCGAFLVSSSAVVFGLGMVSARLAA